MFRLIAYVAGCGESVAVPIVALNVCNVFLAQVSEKLLLIAPSY